MADAGCAQCVGFFLTLDGLPSGVSADNLWTRSNSRNHSAQEEDQSDPRAHRTERELSLDGELAPVDRAVR